MRLVSVIIAFALVSVMCAAREENARTSSVFEEALGKLTKRGSEAHPWVVFTSSPTKRFVQFGYEKGTLFIDVPLAGKSEDEKKKLERVFRSIGVERPVVMAARDPKTLKPFTSHSYQAAFSEDVQRAVDFALRIFREVYEIETPSIVVEVGSG
jgi:hypothetical protein